MAEATMLSKGRGYEVWRRGDEVLLCDRCTFAPGIAVWILAGLGLIVAGNGAAWLAMHLKGDDVSAALPIGFLVVAAVLLFATWRVYRLYADRRDRPPEQAVCTLTADLSASVLRHEGTDIARLDDTAWKIGYDPIDHVRGFTWRLWLTWKGGRFCVGKFGSRDNAEAFREAMVNLGFGD